MNNFQRVPLGTIVKAPSINKCDVSENCKGRIILLDDNVAAVTLAFDEEIKRYVYVNQEAVIKYRLVAMTRYLFLCARCQTDMEGNIVGKNIIVEYLPLSEGTYKEFCDAVKEQGNTFTSIVLKKEKKGDFSFLKAIPSLVKIQDIVQKRINKIKTTGVDPLWELVQINVAMDMKAYEELRKKKNLPVHMLEPAPIPMPAAPPLRELEAQNKKDWEETSDEFESDTDSDEFDETPVPIGTLEDSDDDEDEFTVIVPEKESKKTEKTQQKKKENVQPKENDDF